MVFKPETGTVCMAKYCEARRPACPNQAYWVCSNCGRASCTAHAFADGEAKCPACGGGPLEQIR